MTSPVVRTGRPFDPVGRLGMVTRLSMPETFVLTGAFGVMVTAMFAVAPGAMSTGLPNPLLFGLTELPYGSRVLDVTALSNASVCMDAVKVVWPAGGPASVNGPICCMLVNQAPLVIVSS